MSRLKTIVCWGQFGSRRKFEEGSSPPQGHFEQYWQLSVFDLNLDWSGAKPCVSCMDIFAGDCCYGDREAERNGKTLSLTKHCVGEAGASGCVLVHVDPSIGLHGGACAGGINEVGVSVLCRPGP